MTKSIDAITDGTEPGKPGKKVSERKEARDAKLLKAWRFAATERNPRSGDICLYNDLFNTLGDYNFEKKDYVRWRDLSLENILCSSAWHLYQEGIYTPFSFNFTTALFEKAQRAREKAEGFGDCVYRSIRNQLKKSFKRNIPLILIIEADKGGRLHAHGVIGISFTDEKSKDQARDAFHRANIEYSDDKDKEGFKNRAIQLHRPYNHIYWACEYIQKNLADTRECVLNERLIHIDQDTLKGARKVHDEMFNRPADIAIQQATIPAPVISSKPPSTPENDGLDELDAIIDSCPIAPYTEKRTERHAETQNKFSATPLAQNKETPLKSPHIQSSAHADFISPNSSAHAIHQIKERFKEMQDRQFRPPNDAELDELIADMGPFP
jgi:hypothetical protein